MHLLTPLADVLLCFLAGEPRPRDPTWASHPQGPWTALRTQVLEIVFQLDLLLACELGHRLAWSSPSSPLRCGMEEHIPPTLCEHLCKAPSWHPAHREKPTKVKCSALGCSYIRPGTIPIVIPSWIKEELSWKPIEKGKSDSVHSQISVTYCI